MLIIITGPPGAGKSTMSQAVALKLQKTVYLPTDIIRSFFVNGSYVPWDTSPKAKKQHLLFEEIVTRMVEQYIKNGYNVILDGIYDDQDVVKLRKVSKKVRAFILLPTLQVTRARDRGREKAKQIAHRVKPLHDYFSKARLKHFELIDSSELDAKQTLRKITSKLGLK